VIKYLHAYKNLEFKKHSLGEVFALHT